MESVKKKESESKSIDDIINDIINEEFASDEEIVYMNKDYIIHVIKRIKDVYKENSIDKQYIEKIFNNYVKDNTRSKNTINSLIELLNGKSNNRMQKV